MKIVLIGYMGSGKSTLGTLLSTTYGIPFLDLDAYIEEKHQMSIPELFEKKGAIYFRKIETEALVELSKSSKSFVLSTGGGTPCYGTNMEVLLSMTPNVFYIKLSVPNLAKRVENTQASRPLIANVSNEDLEEFIGKHLFERTSFYNQSHHIVNADGQSVGETVNAIVALVHQ